MRSGYRRGQRRGPAATAWAVNLACESRAHLPSAAKEPGDLARQVHAADAARMGRPVPRRPVLRRPQPGGDQRRSAGRPRTEVRTAARVTRRRLSTGPAASSGAQQPPDRGFPAHPHLASLMHEPGPIAPPDRHHRRGYRYPRRRRGAAGGARAGSARDPPRADRLRGRIRMGQTPPGRRTGTRAFGGRQGGGQPRRDGLRHPVRHRRHRPGRGADLQRRAAPVRRRDRCRRCPGRPDRAGDHRIQPPGDAARRKGRSDRTWSAHRSCWRPRPATNGKPRCWR
jgi:hypothetical protein